MKYYVALGEREIGLDVVHSHEGTLIRAINDLGEAGGKFVNFASVHSDVDTGEGLYSIIVDGRSYQLYLEPLEHGFSVMVGRQRIKLSVLTEREWRLRKSAPRQVAHSGESTVAAPMPGLVKEVLVSVGDAVRRGQRLVVLEAMKMENDINAPTDGTVSRISVEAGTVVESGKPLLSIES